MNNNQIIEFWKSYGQRLDESLQLNRQNTLAVTRLKMQSLLQSMKPAKVFAVIAGILWVLFVDSLIIRLFHAASPFFLISAIIQVLLTKLAIGIYLYQLILIHEANTAGPVLATQTKLARLQASTIWVARLLFLQLPVWTTFYWNSAMLENGNTWLYVLQAAATLSFTFGGIWLFFNIKAANRHKKWFQAVFNGSEWTPVIAAMELLKDAEAFKEND